MSLRDDLQEHIRALEADLIATKRALAAYDGTPIRADAPKVGPNLTNLPIGNAIRAYLEWAQTHKRGAVEAGEMYEALIAADVTTARDGRFLRDVKQPWRAFCIALSVNPQFHAQSGTGSIRKTSPVSLVPKEVP